MTCKDCIHDKVCRNKNELIQEDIHTYFRNFECERVENYCYHFKNKADFVEVKHGVWTFARSGRKVVCSCCETPAPFKKNETYHTLWNSDYCPNCGAKMDGGKAE